MSIKVSAAVLVRGGTLYFPQNYLRFHCAMRSFFYFKCMFGGGKGQGAAGFLPYQKAFRLALLPAKPTEKRKDFSSPIKVR